jgi:branched-chain amino acid transport system substrate-binding protein
VGQRKKVIRLRSTTASNTTTGVSCQRFGFRLMADNYLLAKALARVLAQQLGHNLKAAYLVPDYTLGTSLYKSLTEATGKYGWKSVNEQLPPPGTTDFSSYLLNIVNRGADVMFNETAGADEIASTKQAIQFGIMKKMEYIIPLFSGFAGKELGPELLEGNYGAEPWWWAMEEKYPPAKYFVADFEKKFGYKPRFPAANTYDSMIIWPTQSNVLAHSFPPKSSSRSNPNTRSIRSAARCGSGQATSRP